MSKYETYLALKSHNIMNKETIDVSFFFIFFLLLSLKKIIDRFFQDRLPE